MVGVSEAARNVLAELTRAELALTEWTCAEDRRPTARAPGDAAVGGSNPGVGQSVVAVRTALGIGIPHYARSKQYRNKPAPSAKKNMKRAKNRGPINAARINQNLIAFPR